MALKLKSNGNNLDLKTNIGQLIKGEDGGYYVPAVDEEGNLTWTSSNEEMPAVEGSNIKGPEGNSGVYVGTEEPTDDDKCIWINPEGEAAEADIFATERYVNEAIASIEFPEPDLSGYALKSEVPSVEGLASEQYVDECISAIPAPDLGPYALRSEIPSLEGYALKTDIPDVSKYALKSEIPDVSAYQTAEQVQAAIETAFEGIANAEDGAY